MPHQQALPCWMITFEELQSFNITARPKVKQTKKKRLSLRHISLSIPSCGETLNKTHKSSTPQKTKNSCKVYRPWSRASSSEIREEISCKFLFELFRVVNSFIWFWYVFFATRVFQKNERGTKLEFNQWEEERENRWSSGTVPRNLIEAWGASQDGTDSRKPERKRGSAKAIGWRWISILRKFKPFKW